MHIFNTLVGHEKNHANKVTSKLAAAHTGMLK